MSGPPFARIWELMRQQVAEGRQAFVVCPRIGDEELPASPEAEGKRPLMAVLEVVERLAAGPLHGLRVESLHGRMAADAKDDVMNRFARGETDVLVSTTVIEVGVDVPNATVMVVLDADRFGISQLHQLRGRIGRGGHPGTCVFVTDADRDSLPAARLLAVAATTDGFELSEVDLAVRREGNVLGAEQSGGRSALNFLRLSDVGVIEQTRLAAIDLVERDLQLVEHPALKHAVDAILNEQGQAFIEKA